MNDETGDTTGWADTPEGNTLWRLILEAFARTAPENPR